MSLALDTIKAMIDETAAYGNSVALRQQRTLDDAWGRGINLRIVILKEIYEQVMTAEMKALEETEKTPIDHFYEELFAEYHRSAFKHGP